MKDGRLGVFIALSESDNVDIEAAASLVSVTVFTF